MSRDARILIFGVDDRLLATRQWVLERVGFSVTSAVDPLIAARLIAQIPFDALILCHSMSQADRARFSTVAKRERPAIKILSMSVDSPEEEDGIDAHLGALDGPRALISKVAALVQGSALNASHTTATPKPLSHM